MMPFPLRLETILERARRFFPAVEVVSRESDGRVRRSNYQELYERSWRLAAGLRAAGLRRGERVATLLWNQAAHLEAYFGAPLAGGVVHPLNLRLHPAQLAAIVRDAGDRFALVDVSFEPLWGSIAPHVGVERVFVCPSEYETLLDAAGAEASAEAGAAEENDGAAMGYTSGTTGDPKGVVYSHRALALHALATALPDAMNLRERDCVLPLVPMFHANAWGIPYTAAMIGCKQVLMAGAFDPADVLDLLSAEQVTFSAGVPMVWQAILEVLEREPGRWRLHPELRVNLGGAPAPEALFRRFDRHGIEVNMGWGMTEMTPVGAMNPLRGPVQSGDHAARTRQGRPLPFVEARRAENGELEVRGPWVAASYWRAAQNSAWTTDGWLRTGDVVRFDEAGLIEIVDRHKDLIRSGGEWISSVALENALAGCTGIREAAVIAVPHAKWQERPLALVVLEAEAEADPEAWQRQLQAHFAGWQCPDRYVVVEALPRTATGKLDKRALRQRYREA